MPNNFLGNESEEQEEIEEGQEVQTFNIKGKEYTQDELDQLVGLGQIAREAEEKFDTKIDRVWPEYSRTKNELKQMQEEMEQLRQKTDKVQQPQADLSVEDEVQRQQALRAAKNLGILTKDVLDDLNFATRDEIRNVLREELAAKDLMDQAKSLEKEIDGSDGRPAFNSLDILEYMDETKIRDINTAYEVKYKDELAEWRASARANAKQPGMNTFRASNAGATRTPKEVKPNRDNLDDLIKRGLSGEFTE